VKSAEEIMNMLEAFDLTESMRDAGELAGVSHHTVARYVAAREGGALSDRPAARAQLVDEFLPKIEEWIDRSKGKLRADVAHDKLVGLGYAGSERTTRRAVAQVKKDYRLGRVRVHRPWVTEPGMWLQYDFGDGPLIHGVRSTLFVAWLAWSRFRVVLAIRDKTGPSVMAALDVTLRRVGGAPTYLLTDSEKTVTSEHVAGMPVRNPSIVEFSRFYGVTVHTCVPADPASKGGSESSVKIAKADLVPKGHQPARVVHLVRRAGGGVRGVLCPGQRPGASGHPPGPGRDARRGTGPVASDPGRAAHGRLRSDPDGAGQHADGVFRGRAVLGPGRSARPNRVGAGAWPWRGRAGHHRPRAAHRPGRGRPAWAGQAG